MNKSFIKSWIKINFAQILGSIIILSFTGAYIILTLHKYWQFEYFWVDNVYFDLALRKIAQLQAPIVYHPYEGWIHIWGDHFHPLIVIFAMIYRVFNSQEAILVAMAIFYGIGGYLGMMSGFTLIKSKVVTLSLLIAYFWYLGTQNAFLSGFHEIALLPTIALFLFWTWTTEKRKLFWFAAILLLMVKESMGVVLGSFGVFMIVANRKDWKRGAILIFMSLIHYLSATKLVIPYFLHRDYLYGNVHPPTQLGEFIIQMTQPKEKIETLLVSYGTFGFLPILVFAPFLLTFQDFLTRFLFVYLGNWQHTLGYHYGWGVVGLLFIASLYSYSFWEKKLNLNQKIGWLVSLLVLSIGFYFHRFYKQPGVLWLVTNRAFFDTTRSNQFLTDFINKVPITNGSIMAQNHLAYHLTGKASYVHILVNDDPKYFSHFSEFEKPEYIVFETRENMNPNNYFPLDEPITKEFAKKLLKSGMYETFYHQGEQWILKLNHKAK